MVHIRGDAKEVLVPIHGKTVMRKGELALLGLGASTMIGAPNDNYGYPCSQLATVTSKAYFDKYLVGVTMAGSVSGVTENIKVATGGIFRAPCMKAPTAGQTAKVGYSVAVATHYSGVSISGVSVVVGPVHTIGLVGICIKAESGCSTVDFTLQTRFSGVSHFVVGAS